MPNLNTLTLKIIYFSYGVCNAGIIPSYHRSALLVPKNFSGIALGIANMFSVLLGIIYIQLISFLISIKDTIHADFQQKISRDLSSKTFQTLQ